MGRKLEGGKECGAERPVDAKMDWRGWSQPGTDELSWTFSGFGI